MSALAGLIPRVRGSGTPIREGRVTQVVGLVIEGVAPAAAVGDLYSVHADTGSTVAAEVVGVRGEHALLMPIGELRGLGVGARLTRRGRGASFPAGEGLLGRVVDALGQPLDGRPLPHGLAMAPLYAPPLEPLERAPVNQPFPLGVRALDAFTTVARGQRIGFFAGAGVGKSVLLGMAMRGAPAEVCVVALVGERGREVGDFVDRVLGPEGLKRSVVVVATSDRSPLERVRAAFAATAIAEHFRDEGAHVMLVMDSLTRFAMAQREIGLAIGEPPTTKGYTPSVFALLPRLVERVAPRRDGGSMTAIYTVLVEGDDLGDPVGDSVRSLLDGHVVLSRDLASRGHFPAVDVLASLSRVMSETVTPEQLAAATRVREVIATCREAQDLLNLGAYVRGRNERLDAALDRLPAIDAFLRQRPDEQSGWDTTLRGLQGLAEKPAAAERNKGKA